MNEVKSLNHHLAQVKPHKVTQTQNSISTNSPCVLSVPLGSLASASTSKCCLDKFTTTDWREVIVHSSLSHCLSPLPPLLISTISLAASDLLSTCTLTLTLTCIYCITLGFRSIQCYYVEQVNQIQIKASFTGESAAALHDRHQWSTQRISAGVHIFNAGALITDFFTIVNSKTL